MPWPACSEIVSNDRRESVGPDEHHYFRRILRFERRGNVSVQPRCGHLDGLSAYTRGRRSRSRDGTSKTSAFLGPGCQNRQRPGRGSGQ